MLTFWEVIFSPPHPLNPQEARLCCPARLQWKLLDMRMLAIPLFKQSRAATSPLLKGMISYYGLHMLACMSVMLGFSCSGWHLLSCKLLNWSIDKRFNLEMIVIKVQLFKVSRFIREPNHTSLFASRRIHLWTIASYNLFCLQCLFGYYRAVNLPFFCLCKSNLRLQTK